MGMTSDGMSIGEIFVSLGLDTSAFDGLTGQALASAEKLAEKTAASMVRAFDTKRAREQMDALVSQLQKDGKSIVDTYDTIRAALLKLEADRKKAHDSEMAAKAAEKAALALYEKQFAELVAQEKKHNEYARADIEQKRMLAAEAQTHNAQQIAALIKIDNELMKQEALRAKLIEQQAASAAASTLEADAEAMKGAAIRELADQNQRIRDALRPEQGPLNRPIAGPGDELIKFGTAATLIGSQISSLGRATTYALTVPITAAAAGMLHYSGKIEQAQESLARLLGSQNLASKLIEDLRKFSLTTPFKFEGSLEAFRKLIEMGFSAKEAIPTMRVLGDQVAALGGNTERLNDLVRVFGKIQQQGYISGVEMRSFRNAAVPAFEDIRESLGLTGEEMRKQLHDGMIRSTTAIPILLAAMRKRSEGEMATMSQTMLGLWENVREKVTFVLADLGNSFLPLAKRVEIWAFNSLDGATKAAKAFGTWDQSAQNATLGFVALLAALGPVEWVLGKIIEGIGGASSAIGYFQKIIATSTGTTVLTGIAGALEVVTGGAIAVGAAMTAWKLVDTIGDLGRLAAAILNVNHQQDGWVAVMNTALEKLGKLAKVVLPDIVQRYFLQFGGKSKEADADIERMRRTPFGGDGHMIADLTENIRGGAGAKEATNALFGKWSLASDTMFKPEVFNGRITTGALAELNNGAEVLRKKIGIDDDPGKEGKQKKGYSEKGITFNPDSAGIGYERYKDHIKDLKKELDAWSDSMIEQNKLLNDMSLIEAGAVPMSNNLATVWLLEKGAVEELNGALMDHERIASRNAIFKELNTSSPLDTTTQILRGLTKNPMRSDVGIKQTERADEALKAFGITNSEEKLSKLRANLEGVVLAVQQGRASTMDYKRALIELTETRIKAGQTLEPWEERNLARLKKQVDGVGQLKKAYQSVTREVTTVLNDFGRNVVDILMPKLKKNDGSIDGIPATVVDKFQTAYNSLSAQGYADPKAALMNTINMIQQAGTVADANAIAIRHFGNEAGPEMVRLLRDSGTAASTVAKLVNTAGDAVTKYSQESKKLNQIAALWNELGRSVFRALITTAGGAISDFVGKYMKQLLDSLKSVLFHIPLIGTALDAIFNGGKGKAGAAGTVTKNAGGIWNAVKGWFGGNKMPGGFGGIPGGSNPLGGPVPLGLPEISGPGEWTGGDDGGGGGGGVAGAVGIGATLINASKTVASIFKTGANVASKALQTGGKLVSTGLSSAMSFATVGIQALSGIVSGVQQAHANSLLDKIEKSTREISVMTWQVGAESLQGIAKNTYLATITLNDRAIDIRSALFDPVAVRLEDINTTLKTTIYSAILGHGVGGGGTGDTYNISIDGSSLDSKDAAIQTLVAGARMLKAAGVRGRSV